MCSLRCCLTVWWWTEKRVLARRLAKIDPEYVAGVWGISTYSWLSTWPALFDVFGVTRGDVISPDGAFKDQLDDYRTTGIERMVDLWKILGSSSGIRRYQSAQEAHVDLPRHRCPGLLDNPIAEMRRPRQHVRLCAGNFLPAGRWFCRNEVKIDRADPQEERLLC